MGLLKEDDASEQELQHGSAVIKGQGFEGLLLASGHLIFPFYLEDTPPPHPTFLKPPLHAKKCIYRGSMILLFL